MDRAIRFVGALLMAASLSVIAVAETQAAELRLSFPGLPENGQVSIAIFNTEEDWRRRKGPVWSAIIAVNDGAVHLTRDLPPGNYAIMAFFDKNGNHELDTLPIGMPTEPYGFSNNSRGLFGPPAWDAATFQLDADGTDQVIRLR